MLNSGERSVAVAVNRNKGSYNALKWAADRLLSKGQTVTLIHVDHTAPPLPATMGSNDASNRVQESDQHSHSIDDFFLPFRVYCSRRDVLWMVAKLDDHDIAKALMDYVLLYRIEILVLGAPSKSGISRLFMKNDVSTSVLKGAPDFCTVYVISKGKIASIREASRPYPLRPMERFPSLPHQLNVDTNFMSPFSRVGTNSNRVPHDEVFVPNTDISFVDSGRLSTDSMFFAFYDNLGSQPPQLSSVDSKDFESSFLESNLVDSASPTEESPSPQKGSQRKSLPPQALEDMEEKVRRLELQMKQTMDMYHAACKEALREKQMIKELQLLRMEDEKRLQAAERAKEEALLMAEKEKLAGKISIKAAIEAQNRMEAQRKALLAAEANKKTVLDTLGSNSNNTNIDTNYQSLYNILDFPSKCCYNDFNGLVLGSRHEEIICGRYDKRKCKPINEGLILVVAASHNAIIDPKSPYCLFASDHPGLLFVTHPPKENGDKLFYVV
ncbi:hypothetical protein RJ640_001540 [Escallonia rubra]|uniref:RING-type E3 ubiquitin transferase n=1 Tax=Escallonia rubra TaxID=112253 RepID=A0AA88RSM2_9ASTE|nr:hypothetical protein RJ640_001540 [Escallonia rubra]